MTPEAFPAASWWALAMTFGSIPGIAWVCFCLGNGYFGHFPSPIAYVKFLFSLFRAKNKAIQDTAKTLAQGPKSAALMAMAIAILLAAVATDSTILAVVNGTSIPAGAIAYYCGFRFRRGRSIAQMRELEARNEIADESLMYVYSLPAIAVWALLITTSLYSLYTLDVWSPW